MTILAFMICSMLIQKNLSGFTEALAFLFSNWCSRYGYYDQAGKLQIVNYSADPEKGFHAEGEHVPKPHFRR